MDAEPRRRGRRVSARGGGGAHLLLLDLFLELAARLAQLALEASQLVLLGLGLFLSRLGARRLRLGRLHLLEQLGARALELLVRLLADRLGRLVELLGDAPLPRLALGLLLLELREQRRLLALERGDLLLRRLRLRAQRRERLVRLLGIRLLGRLARAHERIRVAQQVELARRRHRLVVRGRRGRLRLRRLVLGERGLRERVLARDRLERLLEPRHLEREQLRASTGVEELRLADTWRGGLPVGGRKGACGVA